MDRHVVADVAAELQEVIQDVGKLPNQVVCAHAPGLAGRGNDVLALGLKPRDAAGPIDRISRKTDLWWLRHNTPRVPFKEPAAFARRAQVPLQHSTNSQLLLRCR